MRVLTDKERVFTSVIGGVEKKFKVVRPSFTQGNKADLIYKKSFTDAIKAGVPTAAQLKDTMDTEYFAKVNKAISDLDLELAEKAAELDKAADEAAGLSIVHSLKELRARRFVEAIKLNTVYENTAETYAESIRNQFYASEVLLDENGKRVYSSFEDFQNKQTDQLAQEALLNIMIFVARISDNYQMDFVENKWLLKNGIINEEGAVIKKELADKEVQNTPLEGSIDKGQEVKAE